VLSSSKSISRQAQAEFTEARARNENNLPNTL